MRHVLSLPARGADHFLEDPLVCQVESACSDLLSSAGVVIPADLSFSSDNLSKTAQELGGTEGEDNRNDQENASPWNDERIFEWVTATLDRALQEPDMDAGARIAWQEFQSTERHFPAERRERIADVLDTKLQTYGFP